MFLNNIVTYTHSLAFVVATIIILTTSVKCESTRALVSGRGMKVKQPPRDTDGNGE